jgi:magnesium-transporting ATPase (P-type)
VAFAVYFYVLQTGTTGTARTYAFAVLVFAELLRSFGARSETKPVWRISLFTNINLVIVVAITFGLQVWSQHNATLGRFLKTSIYAACRLLPASRRGRYSAVNSGDGEGYAARPAAKKD